MGTHAQLKRAMKHLKHVCRYSLKNYFSDRMEGGRTYKNEVGPGIHTLPAMQLITLKASLRPSTHLHNKK